MLTLTKSRHLPTSTLQLAGVGHAVTVLSLVSQGSTAPCTYRDLSYSVITAALGGPEGVGRLAGLDAESLKTPILTPSPLLVQKHLGGWGQC